MDPEASTCLLTLLYAYGKPRQPPVHKYSSLRSTAHRVAAGALPMLQAAALHTVLHALHLFKEHVSNHKFCFHCHHLFHGRTRTAYLYRCVWSGITGR